MDSELCISGFMTPALGDRGFLMMSMPRECRNSNSGHGGHRVFTKPHFEQITLTFMSYKCTLLITATAYLVFLSTCWFRIRVHQDLKVERPRAPYEGTSSDFSNYNEHIAAKFILIILFVSRIHYTSVSPRERDPTSVALLQVSSFFLKEFLLGGRGVGQKVS